MNVKIQMTIVLACVALTAVGFVIDGPSYFHAVSQTLHAHGAAAKPHERSYSA